MELAIQKSRIFTILLIYLIITSEIFCSRNSLKIKKISLKIHNEFPFQNPLGNLIAGIGQTLVGGERKFFNCFPKEWRLNTSLPNPIMMISDSLLKILSGWVGGLEVFLKMGGPIIKVFCSNRKKIISLIQKVMLKKKLRKYRVMFENGYGKIALKLLLKRYGWGWGSLVKAVKKGVNSANNFVNNTISKAKKMVQENLIDPIFNSWFNPVKNKVIGLVNKITGFFQNDLLIRLQKCSKNLEHVLIDFRKMFELLKKKFDDFNLAIKLGLPSAIFYACDMLVALICEQDPFNKAIKMIVEGIKNKVKNEQYYLLGQGIGIIIRTFAFSKTMIGEFLKSKS